MMGRTHALTGAMAFGLAAPVLGAFAGLTAGELLLGTAVCAGAAVLPDIDHPGAGISRTFGPVTRGFARLVAWASGGHRRGTHSLTGAGVFTLLASGATALYAGDAWWLVTGGVAAGVLVAGGALVAAAGAPDGHRAAHRVRRTAATAWTGAAAVLAVAAAALWDARLVGMALLAALLILTLSAVARIVPARRLLGLRREWDDMLPAPVTVALLWAGVDLRVVPLAVTLGVLVHIIGDMVTLGGCPLGWPWSSAMCGPRWFRTGAAVEQRLVFPVCASVLAVTAAWNTGVITALTGGA